MGLHQHPASAHLFLDAATSCSSGGRRLKHLAQRQPLSIPHDPVDPWGLKRADGATVVKCR